jgi:SAM-dependent methyltransferase
VRSRSELKKPLSIKLKAPKKSPQPKSSRQRVASPWKAWPVWTSEHKFKTPNFAFNCSVSDYSGKTGEREIAILKDRNFIDIYRKLAADLDIQNVFEIGYFQGGMPLFLSDMIKPKKIVAVDWFPPSDFLNGIVTRNKLSESIEFIGDVDQANAGKLREIVTSRFGKAPLDLIIDDCSHYYEHTKGCFEQLFGYLRPGGKYIIEDWGWTHWPGAPWQTKDSHFNGKPSMSNLVFEIIMAFASNKELIANIEFPSWACMVITRGKQLRHGEAIDLAALTNVAGGRSAALIVEPPREGTAAVAPKEAGQAYGKPGSATVMRMDAPLPPPKTWRSFLGF